MTNFVKQELTLETITRLQQQLLDVREPWNSSRLIERVCLLIPADHSCSCQRLFEKSKIQDFRELASYILA